MHNKEQKSEKRSQGLADIMIILLDDDDDDDDDNYDDDDYDDDDDDVDDSLEACVTTLHVTRLLYDET